MLSQETRNALFNLVNQPDVWMVEVNEANDHNTMVRVYSVTDASFFSIVNAVKAIIPDSEFTNISGYESTDGEKYCNRLSYKTRGIDITLCLYESIKKDSAQDGATQENLSPDYTSDMEVAQ